MRVEVPRIAIAIATIILTGLTLVGCVPAMVRRSPAVAGAVTLDGVPVAAAKVFVQSDANAACNASKVHTVTDERGAFAIPVKRSFEMYSPIQLGDRGYGWRLCFEHQGRYYLGYHEMGWGTAPKKARLECDLATEANSTEGGVGSPNLCKRHEP